MPAGSTRMRRLTRLVIGLLWAGAAPAEAQWSFGAYLGAAHTTPATLTLHASRGDTRLTFTRVRIDTESLTPPPYYGYRIGRQICCGGVSLEAELVHLKAYARVGDAAGQGRSEGEELHAARLADHLPSFAMSHGLNFLLANLVVRQALASSRIVLVGRGGLGAVVPHVEAETRDGRSHEYQLAGFGVHGAAGLEVRLSRWMHASGEYKYTRAEPRLGVAGGELKVTTRSHHLAIGLTVMPR